MQLNLSSTGSNSDIAGYLSRVNLPSQQETLGSVVAEILRSGQTLNRKAICIRLIVRLDKASSDAEEQQLHALTELLFSK
ncbi:MULTISPECIES: regulatory protein YcgZ [Pantoea]|uniref:regulatory protein YcgZ n=1 Tax=Pantoea TaxID=53335 RepID=UPI00224D6FD5|nr:regulatory protein YcgZ [Pantoea vagans]MCX3308286.1 regulatory protein YcgZ [Pantoea vagans]